MFKKIIGPVPTCECTIAAGGCGCEPRSGWGQMIVVIDRQPEHPIGLVIKSLRAKTFHQEMNQPPKRYRRPR